jgi:hypothetical protein
MKITKTRLVKLVKEELNAVLQEKEDDWISGAVDPENKGGLHRDLGIPKDEKIPTGLLRKKKKELRKAAEGDKTLSREDKQLLDRIQFALNVRTPKKEGCADSDKEVIEHVGTVSEPPPHARRVATPMKADPVGVQGDLFLHSLLGQIASDPEFANAGERAIAAELYRRAMDQAAHLEEDTMVFDNTAGNAGVWLDTEKEMYPEGALDETGMSGYEGPDLPPEAMEELVTAVLHVLRRMGFAKKEVPPEEKDA